MLDGSCRQFIQTLTAGIGFDSSFESFTLAVVLLGFRTAGILTLRTEARFARVNIFRNVSFRLSKADPRQPAP